MNNKPHVKFDSNATDVLLAEDRKENLDKN